MKNTFWTNHYLSTALWWVVLIFLIKDLKEISNWVIWVESSIFMVLTFIRGYNFHKFKQKQKG